MLGDEGVDVDGEPELGLANEPQLFRFNIAAEVHFAAQRDEGHTPDSLWFTRAAFSAAALKDADGAGDAALHIYERVRDAGIPASRDAQKRIEKMTGAKAP